jgi:hypothetical protein
MPTITHLHFTARRDLSDNMLHGPFPAWLNWRMNSFRFLNLSHNQINGTLQKPFGDCDRIEVLYVMHLNAQTAAAVPNTTYSGFDFLSRDLSHNRLTATTLAIFGSLRRLRHVYVR